jgi:hypothetical protein
MYLILDHCTTEISASRHKSRKLLRLLGGSRQDIAAVVLKAAVFPRYSPTRSDHPAHEILRGPESQSDSAVKAGRRRPNALDAG